MHGFYRHIGLIAEMMHPIVHLTIWPSWCMVFIMITYEHNHRHHHHVEQKFYFLFQTAVGSRKTWDQVFQDFISSTIILHFEIFPFKPILRNILSFDTKSGQFLTMGVQLHFWCNFGAILVWWLNLMNRKLQKCVQFENRLHCKIIPILLKLLIGSWLLSCKNQNRTDCLRNWIRALHCKIYCLNFW